MLFFLQDWKAMILPMIDVPVSLIGTFAVMALLGFTLNNLTLFGLVLAIGIVVDDAIVVLENIERLIATGLDRASGDDQGHGRGHRPDHRHHAGAELGVLAGRVPAGHHGSVLPAVRADHRVGDGDLGHQRHDADAVASRHHLQDRARAHGGHEHQREALPWWIFGVLGGLVTVWLGKPYLAPMMGLPLDEEARINVPKWLPYAVYVVCFLPGLLAGGLLGKLIIKPVNFVLGRFFQGFNWVFDKVAAFYGKTMAGLVRVSAIVLLIYGGLIFLTYYVMNSSADRLHPRAGPGLFAGQCSVARLAPRSSGRRK